MERNNFKVSIIVPVYNVENYLNRCVGSILKQSYKNIEILLIDDGSTDDSGFICDKLAEKDDRIKVFHKSNGGLSDTRNYGIDNSNGKYISFVDSDDVIDEKFVELLVNNAIKYNADISACGYKSFSHDVPKARENNKCKFFDSSYEGLKYFLKFEKSFMCTKLFKKELFDDIKIKQNKYYEDIFTTYKLYLKANRVVVSNYKGYFYYQRANSISNQHTKIKLKDAMDGIFERYSEIKKIYPDFYENKQVLVDSFLDFYYKSFSYCNDELADYIIEKGYYKFIKKKCKNDTFRIFRMCSFKSKIKFLIIKIKKSKIIN